MSNILLSCVCLLHRSTSTSVTIYISDINDNCPEFLSPPATYYGELSSQDVYVVDPTTSKRLMLIAQDPDQVFNVILTYFKSCFVWLFSMIVPKELQVSHTTDRLTL